MGLPSQCHIAAPPRATTSQNTRFSVVSITVTQIKSLYPSHGGLQELFGRHHKALSPPMRRFFLASAFLEDSQHLVCRRTSGGQVSQAHSFTPPRTSAKSCTSTGHKSDPPSSPSRFALPFPTNVGRTTQNSRSLNSARQTLICIFNERD